MGMLESEGDWLPGGRVSPPWAYLIRLPVLRVVPAMHNKRVYRLTQNSGLVKQIGTGLPLRDPAVLDREDSIGDVDDSS